MSGLAHFADSGRTSPEVREVPNNGHSSSALAGGAKTCSQHDSGTRLNGSDRPARAPRFKQFLEEIFPHDAEAQEGLLEMIGLCMTDETKYQKAFMFVGP